MPAEQFRRDRMMALTDFAVGTGLEIGPLDRPIALKAEQDVRYVDVFDTEAIRHHYRNDPGVHVDAIPDLDFALQAEDGRIQSLVEAVGSAAPYRWVVASHVIEHVPDLLGWLTEVAAVLDDGGTLVLAVPDRRFTFDVLRPVTTVGQILQAHDAGDTIPSIRAVYDYFRSVVTVTAPDLWAGKPVTEDQLIYDLPGVQAQLDRTRGGEYVDCHVWMFTPAEFVEQLVELGRMNLIDFTVDSIVPTATNELEFYAALTRIPRGASEAEVAKLRSAGVQHFVDEITRPEPAAPAEPGPEAEAQAEVPAGPEVEVPAVPEPEVTAPEIRIDGVPGDAAAIPFPVSPREMRLIRAKRRVVNTLLRR